MTKRIQFSRNGIVGVRAAALIAVLVTLAGCVDPPPPRTVYADPPPQRPNTDVYAYPTKGQTPQQQDRDRYECSQWATQQTGFDPSAPNVPPQDRVRVVSAGPPPGTGTALGALTGALLGAAIAGPRDAGAGLVAGAVVGGAIGTASDAQRAQETTVVTTDRQALARIERQATDYKRAISACLDARGYSVK